MASKKRRGESGRLREVSIPEQPRKDDPVISQEAVGIDTERLHVQPEQTDEHEQIDEQQQTDEQQRRSNMTVEEHVGRNDFRRNDFNGVARVWKDAYLGGLEATLKWHQQNEDAAKSMIKQGFSITQHWLGSYKTLVENWDVEPGQEHSNPWLALSRQVLQAVQTATEPVVKTGMELCDTTFHSYETAWAGPCRKYVLELNKKMMDTVIPS